ncbi:MAG: OmpA family protein [Sphingomonadales bacterium]|nr:OmpA family protein [Sphingomonadales bacterium]
MTVFRQFLFLLATCCASLVSFAQGSKSFDQYDITLTPACFNTPYDDFATRKLGDKIYVLSAAKNACEDIDMDEFAKKPFSDLYEVNGCQLKDPTLMAEETKSLMLINTCYYDGPISTNAKGDLLFFTNNHGSDKNEKLTIYYSTKNANNEWSKPVAIPFNNDKYNVTHPFYDEKNKLLYFSSDMPGGSGGMDIYKCTFDKGKFGQKEVVRFVNTDKNDIFPIVYKDKLYFTSQGHKSTGGYDLFVMENLEVLNIGAPFNSVNDDLAIFFTDDKNGYITSNRGTAGATDDIYAFNLKEKFVDLPLDYVVTDAQTGEPVSDVAIRIVDDSTGIVLFAGNTNEIGLLSQMLDSIPLETKMRLKIFLDKEGYVSKEIAFDLVVKDSNRVLVSSLIDLTLEPLSLEQEITALLGLKSIYYDFDKADLRPDAIIELDKVVRFMNKHAKIEVELGSHTDCRGTAIYNQDLSNRRAVNAANYVKARISNPDRITFKGYGETQLKVDCPCEGRIRSKCSDEENQLNRRTEFIIKSLNITTGSAKVAPKGGTQTEGGNVNFVIKNEGAADFRLKDLEDPTDMAGVHFRVQVESSAAQIPNATAKFKREDVYEYEHERQFKYCLGTGLRTLDEAVKLQNELRSNGYPGAFVIAFNNKNRISLDQAKKLLSGQ